VTERQQPDSDPATRSTSPHGPHIRDAVRLALMVGALQFTQSIRAVAGGHRADRGSPAGPPGELRRALYPRTDSVHVQPSCGTEGKPPPPRTSSRHTHNR
jgi:hypothetical protein